MMTLYDQLASLYKYLTQCQRVSGGNQRFPSDLGSFQVFTIHPFNASSNPFVYISYGTTGYFCINQHGQAGNTVAVKPGDVELTKEQRAAAEAFLRDNPERA
jgi:hypothetical protein